MRTPVIAGVFLNLPSPRRILPFMTNTHIALTFERIGKMLALQGEYPFRVRAYERAAQVVMSMTEDVAALYKERGTKGLMDIPGIGEDLAAKIEEMVTTGKLAFLTELEKQIPKGVLEIATIQSMGTKKTQFVWQKFKVKHIDDLERLAKSGKLNTLKGWGDKSVENILIGIQAKRTHDERVALPVAFVWAAQLKEPLHKSGLCDDLEIAGSLRR